MLSNKLGAVGGKDFRARTKIRILFGLLIALAGVIMLVVFLVTPNLVDSLSDYVQGFYVGLSGGLIAAGAITAIRQIMLLRNPEKLKRVEVEENDERNRAIRQTALRWTCWILLIAAYGVALVGMALNPAVANVILIAIGIALLLYLICYIIAQRRL